MQIEKVDPRLVKRVLFCFVCSTFPVGKSPLPALSNRHCGFTNQSYANTLFWLQKNWHEFWYKKEMFFVQCWVFSKFPTVVLCRFPHWFANQKLWRTLFGFRRIEMGNEENLCIFSLISYSNIARVHTYSVKLSFCLFVTVSEGSHVSKVTLSVQILNWQWPSDQG